MFVKLLVCIYEEYKGTIDLPSFPVRFCQVHEGGGKRVVGDECGTETHDGEQERLPVAARAFKAVFDVVVHVDGVGRHERCQRHCPRNRRRDAPQRRPARPRRTPYAEYPAHGTYPGELSLYRRLQHVAPGRRFLRDTSPLDLGPAAQPLDHGDLCQEHDATEAELAQKSTKTRQKGGVIPPFSCFYRCILIRHYLSQSLAIFSG